MGEILVKRTKILYASIGLMLFGALGVCVQVTQSDAAVGVVAPALADACKDYNFYKGHVPACGTAATVTSTPSPSAPGSTGTTINVEARPPVLTSANR